MKTILIIQEDKILRENICDFLKEEGYDVISAEDGLTGLQLAIDHQPDLIICDIIMPRMNGYDFYKTIQQIKSTSIIPLIFLTGKAEKEDVRAGMHLGADDYLTKPFDFSELLGSIKTRLDKFEKIQQKSDEKFYALTDNPSIGVFIYSKNKFDFMNEKCANIFGLTKDEISKTTFDDLVIGNEKDHVLEKIDQCIKKTHNSLHIRFHAIHSKGKQKIALEIFAGIVNYKGSDSLIGNITECHSVTNGLLFTDEKDPNAKTLSKKELEILTMICQGNSNSEIARILELSKRTVESHRASILKKTDVKNTADLVIYAVRNNLIGPI